MKLRCLALLAFSACSFAPAARATLILVSPTPVFGFTPAAKEELAVTGTGTEAGCVSYSNFGDQPGASNCTGTGSDVSFHNARTIGSASITNAAQFALAFTIDQDPNGANGGQITLNDLMVRFFGAAGTPLAGQALYTTGGVDCSVHAGGCTFAPTNGFYIFHLDPAQAAAATAAGAFANLNDVVGLSATLSNGNRGPERFYLLSDLPEPRSALLCGLGLALMLAALWRKRPVRL